MTPAMQDLVSGQIDLMIADPASAIPQFRAGRIKLFALTASSRSASAPDIPTVDEAGLPGFYLAPWHGMWAPKATPKSIIATLNAAGSNIPPRGQQTPEALAAFHKAEIEKWWPIVTAANIKAE
jgi:tripartite-type tricarboxylate transporter receptor subunit TctC